MSLIVLRQAPNVGPKLSAQSDCRFISEVNVTEIFRQQKYYKQLVSLPPSSATTTTGPGPATCMYWTPWVNTNTPDATGDYETIMHLNSLVQSCNSSSIRAIECRTVGSRKSWNEAGDMDVKCDLDSQGLLCFNKVQRSGQCQDYEIRVFCDECPSKNSNSGSLDMRLFLLRRIKQILKKLRI